MNDTKLKNHPLKTLKTLWLGVALCAAVGLACFVGGRLSARSGETARLDAVVLENQLIGISEWASAAYQYTNMAQFESSNDFYGMRVPFTTKRFILTYDGEITAGVNMNDVSVDVSGERVTVRLPRAEILSHEIDEASVEVFDEKTSIFNPFTVEDFTAFQADQKVAVEEKALAKGLLDTAQKKAEDAVEDLLSSALPEEYTLTVEHSA